MKHPRFNLACLFAGDKRQRRVRSAAVPAAIVCWPARWYEGDQARESSVEPARRWRYACS